MYDVIEKTCLFIVNILYHQTIYCTILFILIFGLAYILKGKSPYWQLGLWFLILVRLLLPTDLSFSLSARNLVDEVPLIDKLNGSMEMVSNKLEINQRSYQNFELNRFDRTGDQRDKKIVFERNLNKDLNRSNSWPIIVAIVWFLGCLILFIFFLNKIFSINRVLNHSALIQDKRITALLDYWCHIFKVRRSVRIISSNEFLSPFTVGLFRPKIFIPQSLIKGADNETINSIIAHEMVHIKHFDYVWIRLQIVLQIIYFFHPVVWYANRQITLARERICDRIVLAKRVIPPSVYGKGVINVLEFNLFGYRLVEPLPCFSNHKKIFEYRIRDILKEDTMKKQKTLFIFLMVCLLGFILLPLSASQTDSPVSEQEIKALTDQYLEIWNKGDLALVDKVYASEFWIEVVDGLLSTHFFDSDALKRNIAAVRTAFPDLNVKIDEIIVKGDRLILRVTFTGTNTGPGQIPPTGKWMKVSSVSIIRVVNGKIDEQLIYYNQAKVLRQLGFKITPPETIDE